MTDFRQVYQQTAVAEYLQITGSVQHLVNLLDTDRRQK